MDLSILIPARNEMFLTRTIQDILANMRGETEIIVALDGAWADPPIPDHERVNIIYHAEPVGQRAATNNAARLSSAKYVMKCDAHCSFGEGFDVILMEDMQDDWTVVPRMYNLHAFDWVCECGHRKYQGPTPSACARCGGQMTREMVWKAKHNPESTAMRFDQNLHFQYWSGYKKRQSGELVETMSLLGACWMLTRDKFWELDICDENHGSWGQQGTEVACKTWLSGGRLICNKRTWFAHLFRTQGGDFGFPYPLSGKQVNTARRYSHKLWNLAKPDDLPRWDKAVRPLSWLINKFAPVPGWEAQTEQVQVEGSAECAPAAAESEGDTLTKGVVYYTDNRLDERIFRAAQAQLEQAVDGMSIVSVSLKPTRLGTNLVLDLERGYLTMFKQILAGLEASSADIIFFAEHDVLYHPSHFEFVPPEQNLFYYNQNCWKVDAEEGKALFHYASQTSGLCAYRTLLLEHYRQRVAMVEANGFSRKMGFEPGTHGRPERVDDYKAQTWMSEYPNIDIRHTHNLTPSRWRREEFRNQRFTKGWTEADEVPGWGRTRGRFDQILDGILGEREV